MNSLNNELSNLAQRYTFKWQLHWVSEYKLQLMQISSDSPMSFSQQAIFLYTSSHAVTVMANMILGINRATRGSSLIPITNSCQTSLHYNSHYMNKYLYRIICKSILLLFLLWILQILLFFPHVVHLCFMLMLKKKEEINTF